MAAGGRSKGVQLPGEEYPKFAEFYFQFLKKFQSLTASDPTYKAKWGITDDNDDGRLPEDMIVACLLMYKYYSENAHLTQLRQQLAQVLVDVFFAEGGLPGSDKTALVQDRINRSVGKLDELTPETQSSVWNFVFNAYGVSAFDEFE